MTHGGAAASDQLKSSNREYCWHDSQSLKAIGRTIYMQDKNYEV